MTKARLFQCPVKSVERLPSDASDKKKSVYEFKMYLLLHLILGVICNVLIKCIVSDTAETPVVVATWNFVNATEAAWQEIGVDLRSAVDGIVVGCGVCEIEQCDGSVGYGGSPDENGESALDAMIMDGSNMKVGSVANLRMIKNAIGVAHAVMKYTKHTLLVGDLATDFAVSMGFTKTNLSTEHSVKMYEDWKDSNCQPNFWQNVVPDPSTSCGPYSPESTVPPRSFRSGKNIASGNSHSFQRLKKRDVQSNYQHDTIGMLAIDSTGNIAGGTSTNGANHKIPGRVGDSPLAGSGAYVDKEVGGAAGTGDGDIMMRFLPSFHAVELMRNGKTPSEAATDAILRISRYYPTFSGAVIALNMSGHYGAACHGLSSFPYTVMSPNFNETQIFSVSCV